MVHGNSTAMDLAAMETEAKAKARKQVANLLQVHQIILLFIEYL